VFVVLGALVSSLLLLLVAMKSSKRKRTATNDSLDNSATSNGSSSSSTNSVGVNAIEATKYQNSKQVNNDLVSIVTRKYLRATSVSNVQQQPTITTPVCYQSQSHADLSNHAMSQLTQKQTNQLINDYKLQQHQHQQQQYQKYNYGNLLFFFRFFFFLENFKLESNVYF
jgi:hypothetical protein